MNGSQNYINHIALVLDASSSMKPLDRKVVEVADRLVKDLAKQSQDFDQETRISLYTFADFPKCAVFDKDALRLPSVGRHYRSYGNTALIDATILAIEDLQKTATLYGDHAFLVYVLTDGQENRSSHSPSGLQTLIRTLDDGWTLAALVPDKKAEAEVIRFGFVPGNVTIWDTTAAGTERAFETITQTTQSYMRARSQGIRSTTGLFSPNVAGLAPSDLTNLQRVPKGQYLTLPVSALHPGPLTIRDFAEAKTGEPYNIGSGYYQLTKPETIQPQKLLAVRHRLSGDLYTGPNARKVLGLPPYELKVAPASHPDYDIFVQSTSVNRKLVPGTSLIVLN